DLWDLNVLRSGMQTIRTVDPSAKMVCCSTGMPTWLTYDKRLFDSGLISSIDITSLHPYQPGPPEVRDGPFNYLERINALRALVRAYGIEKPIWATEANWIIGPSAATNLTAPGHDEQDQAEYVARVNLLSLPAGVKYFLHFPFVH